MSNRILLLLLLAFVHVGFAQPQGKQFLYSDDWTYNLIDYWLTNQTIHVDHVLNQPYTIGEIRRQLKDQKGWQKLVRRYYQKHYAQMGYGKISFYGRENFSIVSDSNLPTRKALQSPPVDDVFFFDNRTKNHYNVSAHFQVLMPHFTLANRTIINSEYKDDPLYAGDTTEWIYGRVNDAYANFSFGNFDFFAGRMARNWGGLQEYGLILSDNSYTFDHLQVSYTKEKFKFSFLVTRLEDLLAQDDLFPDSLIAARKFLSAQRIDFSFSKRLQMSFSQLAVYGGSGRDFEFAFLNPANFFYLSQRNDKLQVNGIWAIDVYFKPHPRWSVMTQFLIDDFVINNNPGQNDRAQHPDRLGLTMAVSNADILLPGLQAKLIYTRIGNRTYQSRRTWENFHYRGKSLGFPTASTEKIGVKLNYFNLFPFLLRLESFFQRRGDINLTDVFPIQKEKFPVGVVEKHFRADLKLRYFLNESAQVSLSFGYETFKNYNNILDGHRNNFMFLVGVQMNHSLEMNLK